MNLKQIKKLIFTTLTMLIAYNANAQGELTLEQCRQRALETNNSLKVSEAKKEQSEALQKVALWQMLPKVSANGGYIWMDRSVNLISEDQKAELGSLGNRVQEGINQAIHDEFGNLPIGGQFISDRISAILTNNNLTTSLNNLGQQLATDLETDTRNLFAGAVTLSQPIYLGGKLIAAYHTATLLDRMNGIKFDAQREQTIIAVDEAYWQVVSVKHKKELAEQYVALLQTLNNNVEQMVEAEVATKGDLAKVHVKLNEAQMSLTRATNGLQLAKMLLAQRCGMPLDTVFDVAGNATDGLDLATPVVPSMDEVWNNRREMQLLSIGDSVAREGVRIAASALKPNIAATAGYMFSNPNVFDGFKNEWGGSFMAGVVVNVPILHPGGIYAVKAAKAKRREVNYQIEEAREMIELQVNKLAFELQLAYKKLAQAQSNLVSAEENMKLADESFKAGMCSSSDLMAAQTAWLQAKGEIVDAEIEIAMSRIYLNQAIGTK